MKMGEPITCLHNLSHEHSYYMPQFNASIHTKSRRESKESYESLLDQDNIER